jgi:sugar phosphate isomerase/epimerase
LYSARKFAPLADQLAIIADCGYVHVETFGPLHDDPASTRRLLADHGLTAASAHIGFDIITEQTSRALDIALALGAGFAIAPFLDERARPSDARGWRELGEKLEKADEVCAPHGVRVAWHNHDFEFRPLADGSMPITHLIGENLLWEPDLAWVSRAGADPDAWARRCYAGRIPIVHVKDIAPAGAADDEGGWADVGAGVLPWARLWAACVASGSRLFVAEHDDPSDFERFARASAAAMRNFQAGGA